LEWGLGRDAPSIVEMMGLGGVLLLVREKFDILI